mmetsp:Transcript_5688/g.16788  ORF Transcript_5688/g.16788 Transcript_5688/m.16788 type:complete len:200 (-) Transcript_5688:74-673(-)
MCPYAHPSFPRLSPQAAPLRLLGRQGRLRSPAQDSLLELPRQSRRWWARLCLSSAQRGTPRSAEVGEMPSPLAEVLSSDLGGLRAGCRARSHLRRPPCSQSAPGPSTWRSRLRSSRRRSSRRCWRCRHRPPALCLLCLCRLCRLCHSARRGGSCPAFVPTARPPAPPRPDGRRSGGASACHTPPRRCHRQSPQRWPRRP